MGVRERQEDEERKRVKAVKRSQKKERVEGPLKAERPDIRGERTSKEQNLVGTKMAAPYGNSELKKNNSFTLFLRDYFNLIEVYNYFYILITYDKVFSKFGSVRFY